LARLVPLLDGFKRAESKWGGLARFATPIFIHFPFSFISIKNILKNNINIYMDCHLSIFLIKNEKSGVYVRVIKDMRLKLKKKKKSKTEMLQIKKIKEF
jgi:hypothetical protein